MKEKLGKNKLLMLVAALVAGIVFMSLNSLVKTERPVVKEGKNPDKVSSQTITVSSDMARMEKLMEQRLEEVLTQIKGAGEVSVTLFLAAGPEYNYAVNLNTSKRTIEEQDQGGGTRVTTEVNEQSQMVMANQSAAGGAPVVVKETKPEVQGVLVVAEGAADPYLKAMLSRAVQTLMGIPAYRVTVLPRK